MLDYLHWGVWSVDSRPNRHIKACLSKERGLSTRARNERTALERQVQETVSCGPLRRSDGNVTTTLCGLIKELVDHNIQMLSEWKGCEVMELTVQVDHIHLIIRIAPNVAISELMGILNGKLAINLFKNYPQLNRSAEVEETLLGESCMVVGLFCEYGWSEKRGSY